MRLLDPRCSANRFWAQEPRIVSLLYRPATRTLTSVHDGHYCSRQEVGDRQAKREQLDYLEVSDEHLLLARMLAENATAAVTNEF